MAELVLLHAAAFVCGLGFGYWLAALRRRRHPVSIYDPPANIAGSIPYLRTREDQTP
ncbi:Uncharacterised protein (plasmid) [Tsukamurella tyrosinosolvens]|uniref:hypothetical protein n=1 Tax=Tsukamurella tyrosinosolvens TaxID=57704 RepID=UPI000A4FBB10|nr:hypothetical protein [Tsukamurella tyrosinosolvens]VEH94153.1 Uncharacterised protein [Tsukamurella tyrosinosolvens]